MSHPVSGHVTRYDRKRRSVWRAKYRLPDGRRLEVQLSFGGREWQTLRLEISKPEADEIEVVHVAVGISDFGLRYQVAQKLHAVTEQPPDRHNLRFWDLIDLMLLEDLLGGDLANVGEAAELTFAARATHGWPPDLVVPKSWREPYARAASEIDAELPLDVGQAADRVRTLIARIAAA